MDERVLELRRVASDERRLRNTFRWVRAGNESANDLMMKAIELVVKADRTVERDRKRTAAAIVGLRDSARCALPGVVHTLEERLEAARFAADDGDKVEELANENEIEAAAVVRRRFRTLLVGENKDRDWDILIALASGESERQVAQRFGLGRATVRRKCRDRQLAAIAAGMSHLVSEPSYRVAIGPESRLIAA